MSVSENCSVGFALSGIFNLMITFHGKELRGEGLGRGAPCTMLRSLPESSGESDWPPEENLNPRSFIYFALKVQECFVKFHYF